MDLYQLSVVVSYCLLSEGLFKGKRFRFTGPMCCVSIVLNAFVSTAHSLLNDDEQNHLMLY